VNTVFHSVDCVTEIANQEVYLACASREVLLIPLTCISKYICKWPLKFNRVKSFVRLLTWYQHVI